MTKTGRWERQARRIQKRFKFEPVSGEEILVKMHTYGVLCMSHVTFYEKNTRKRQRAWWKAEKARLGL